MALKDLLKNSYFYLFLGCIGTLGSLGITILIAEKANSSPIPDPDERTYPGIVRPECPAATQTQLNICAHRWEQATDQRRQEVYNDLIATLSPAQQTALEHTDQAWSIFETNYCRLLSDGYRGGTIQPLILSTCRAERDNERIETLRQWSIVDTDHKDADYETVTATLTESYQAALQEGSPREQERLPLNQIFWEIYQARQCNWAAIQAENAPQQQAQCLTRLSLQRLNQLKLF